MALDKVIRREPRISYIGSDESTRRREYVQRSLILRFPDVITYATVPIGSGKSTLAIHSYSIYGAGDLGVNGNRVRTFLRNLEKEIPSTGSLESE